MTSKITDKSERLRSSRQAVINALNTRNGFRAVQTRLREDFVAGIISNETQQEILAICEPIRERNPDPHALAQMVAKIEGLFNDLLLNAWRETHGEGI